MGNDLLVELASGGHSRNCRFGFDRSALFVKER